MVYSCTNFWEVTERMIAKLTANPVNESSGTNFADVLCVSWGEF